MIGRPVGLILSNFMYLIMFYLAYFPMTIAALYAKDQICTTITLFTAYCNQIPASTTLAMNFMLFALIPLAALIFTIMASRQPTQEFVS